MPRFFSDSSQTRRMFSGRLLNCLSIFFFVFVKNKAEFGGDLNTILKGRNCFAHKFFVFSADASIDLGGVKKN